MVKETAADSTYLDADMTTYIARYPLCDQEGQDPIYRDTSTTPVTLLSQDEWIPTWDIRRAAADICYEKEADASTCFDVNADGADMKRDQIVQHWKNLGDKYLSMASPRMITVLLEEPTET
jgi:hypothetical protein